jgi:hypothetical protein
MENSGSCVDRYVWPKKKKMRGKNIRFSLSQS